MFNGASSFNSDISNWDVSSVTNMGVMFYGASSFNSDISNWDVSSVTGMGGMFNGASSFNSDISNWNIARVPDLSGMFYSATNFNQNLCPWGPKLPSNFNYTTYAITCFTTLVAPTTRLHIPAGILRIPVFPFLLPVSHRNLNFRSAVILFFGIKRSKNLRSKTKASGRDHGVPGYQVVQFCSFCGLQLSNWMWLLH